MWFMQKKIKAQKRHEQKNQSIEEITGTDPVNIEWSWATQHNVPSTHREV